MLMTVLTLTFTNLAVILENIKKVHEIVLVDVRLKLRVIIEELKISEGGVFTILHEYWPIRKTCSMWLPCLLSVDQNKNASTIQIAV